MDLGTVRVCVLHPNPEIYSYFCQKKLLSDNYTETNQFSDDCRTIWMNCEIFNVPGDIYSTTARQFSEEFERFSLSRNIYETITYIIRLWKRLLKKWNDLIIEHRNSVQPNGNKSTKSSSNREQNLLIIIN